MQLLEKKVSLDFFLYVVNQTNIIRVVTRATQCMPFAKGRGSCRVRDHQIKEVYCVIVEAFYRDVNNRSI